MNELASKFSEVILNGTWIANTNFKKELDNLPVEIANYKIEKLNTIADLARHIHYYINGVKSVLNGGELIIRDQFSFDFKQNISQKEWEEFLSIFWKDALEFTKLINELSEEKLDSVFVKSNYGSYRRNIDGIIEHSYYHLGQIVLLKKIIGNLT